MNPKKLKFYVGIFVILATFVWLSFSGYQEGKAYYVTVEELQQMKEKAYTRRLKVAGDVVENSIQNVQTQVKFTISQDHRLLPVVYVGNDPLPDTFKAGAKVVVEGKLLENDTFEAKHIQAKCASKYEAEFKIEKPKNQNGNQTP
jgi:cytochrome c-type biogenesis protein CcmE